MLEIAFREQLIGRTHIFQHFSKIRSSVTSVEGCRSISRTWKYEESLCMKLLPCWDCIWVNFEQHKRQSEHTLGCHQIHTLPAEWRAEGELCQHMPGPFWASVLTTFCICDFLLFPELPTVHFTKCFAQWHDHEAHCMKFQGDYLEGMLLCWNIFSPETIW